MEQGSYTDIGKVRKVNEDDYYVSDYVSDVGAMYAMVADGMGGHSAGDVASSMAIHVACDYIEANFDPQKGTSGVGELLKSAVTFANNSVFSSAITKEGLSGMGTTFTMCFILGKDAVVCHVGDSRLYKISEGGIKRLTRDHSLVEELVTRGNITETEAKRHPQKNVITRAVGTSAEVKADIFQVKLKENDILLLCTDGLTNSLSDEALLKTVSEEKLMMKAAEKLVCAANEAGGKDNITAVLLKI